MDNDIAISGFCEIFRRAFVSPIEHVQSRVLIYRQYILFSHVLEAIGTFPARLIRVKSVLKSIICYTVLLS